MASVSQICQIHIFERFEKVEKVEECKGELWDTLSFDKSKPNSSKDGTSIFNLECENPIPSKGIIYIPHNDPDVSDGINLEYTTPLLKIPNYSLGTIKPEYTSDEVKNKYKILPDELRLLISSNEYLNGKISITLVCNKSAVDPLFHSVESQTFYIYKPTVLEIKMSLTG